MSKKKKPFVTDWNWHHRLAKKNGGSGRIDGPNMSHVQVEHHRAFHMLFDTKPVPEIARILNDTWIDPAWMLVAVRKDTL